MSDAEAPMLAGAKVSPRPPEKASPRDRLRSLVQAEVARAGPADTARRSLELIVETTVRAREVNGRWDIAVLDDTGQVRTRIVDGHPVPLTIADAIEELRHKHPTLFKPRSASVAMPTPPREVASAASPQAGAAALPASPPGPARRERDWMDLGPTSRAPSDEPAKPALAEGARVRLQTLGRSGAAAMLAAGPFVVRSLGRARARLRTRRRITAYSSSVVAGPDRPRRWLPALGAVAVLAALLVGAAVLVPRLMSPGDAPSQVAANRPAPGPAAAARDPATTGSVTPARPAAITTAAPSLPAETGPLRGVAEVLDTSTLRLQDRIVRLFGVEWARGGGDPDDLVKYLRGREVSCEPAGAADSYRCQVEGQDLSRVVLFNGGGRTTSDATAELRAAEDHARQARMGVWKESRAPAP